MMRTMDSLMDMLEDELSEIVATGTIDDKHLDWIYKIVDIVKDIGEIEGGRTRRSRRTREDRYDS